MEDKNGNYSTALTGSEEDCMRPFPQNAQNGAWSPSSSFCISTRSFSPLSFLLSPSAISSPSLSPAFLSSFLCIRRVMVEWSVISFQYKSRKSVLTLSNLYWFLTSANIFCCANPFPLVYSFSHSFSRYLISASHCLTLSGTSFEASM